MSPKKDYQRLKNTPPPSQKFVKLKTADLGIVYCNVMHSEWRLRDLIAWASVRPEAEGKIHVICVIDVPKEIAWMSEGRYSVWYECDEIIAKTAEKGSVPLASFWRVAFYVHKDFKNHWKAFKREDNPKLAATLELECVGGRYIAIHNGYNPNQPDKPDQTNTPNEQRLANKMDVAEFVRISSQEGANVMVADLNAKFRDWSSPKENITGEAQRAGIELHEALETTDLVQLTKKGDITFRRGESQGVLDLGFASRVLADRVTKCQPLKPIGLLSIYATDHRPVELRIDMQINYSFTPSYPPPRSEEDKHKFVACLRKRLPPPSAENPFPVLDSGSSIDEFAKWLQGEVHRAIVTTRRRDGHSRPQQDPCDTPEIQRLCEQARVNLEKSEDSGRPESERTKYSERYAEATKSADKLIKLERKKGFWAYNATEAKDKSIHRLAKTGKRWTEPKAPKRLDAIEVNGVESTDTNSMTLAVATSWWPSEDPEKPSIEPIDPTDTDLIYAAKFYAGVTFPDAPSQPSRKRSPGEISVGTTPSTGHCYSQSDFTSSGMDENLPSAIVSPSGVPVEILQGVAVSGSQSSIALAASSQQLSCSEDNANIGNSEAMEGTAPSGLNENFISPVNTQRSLGHEHNAMSQVIGAFEGLTYQETHENTIKPRKFQPQFSSKDASASRAAKATRSSANSQQRSPQHVLKSEDYDELEDIIDHLRPTGPSHDLISNEYIRIGKDVLRPYLEHLSNACFKLGHFPKCFKFTKTIAIYKGKGSRKDPSNSRPITLICCLSKILERIIANRVGDVVKRKGLMPMMQFAGAGKSAPQALQCLINQVIDGWCYSASPNHRRESSVLFSDIEGAYNHVDHSKLKSVLEDMEFDEWIIRIVLSFLSGRSTTLELPGHKLALPFYVLIGLPQGSPLSQILFLLLIAPILRELEGEKGFGTLATLHSFVDDMSLLVTSESVSAAKCYKQNNELISRYFERIEVKAKELGVKFKPSKFELIHFRRPHSEGERETSRPEKFRRLVYAAEKVKVLGVIVDHELTFKSHVNYLDTTVKNIMDREWRRISTSSLGAPFFEMATLYRTTAIPKIAWGVGVWFLSNDRFPRRASTVSSSVDHLDTPTDTVPSGVDHLDTPADAVAPRKPRPYAIAKGSIDKLESLQRYCMLKITGGIKTTSTHLLRHELDLPRLEQVLDLKAMSFHARALGTDFSNQLSKWRSEYPTYDKGARGKGTPESRHLERLERHPYHLLEVKAKELRADADERDLGEVDSLLKAEMQKKCSEEWNEFRHKNYPESSFLYRDTPAVWLDWDQKALRFYQGLERYQGVILFMYRTGCIGLNKYLHSIGAVGSPFCDCIKKESSRQKLTAEHIFCHCSKFKVEREALVKAVGHTNMQALATKDAAIASDWALCCFPLPMFDFARRNYKHRFSHLIRDVHGNTTQLGLYGAQR